MTRYYIQPRFVWYYLESFRIKVSEPNHNLGRLVSVHGLQPAYLQRAVFVVVLSFLFFLGTMVIFYLQQGFVYFLLSTAFLVIYLVTMTSWILQRRNVVKLYENGIEYRKYSWLWNEIDSISAGEANTVVVSSKSGAKFTISATISGLDQIVRTIKSKL